MIILEEHFKWHLEAFASELFNYSILYFIILRFQCIFDQIDAALVSIVQLCGSM